MSLIGLSGKAGAGKDTVADIIQYLMDYNRAGYSHPQTEKDLNSWKKNVQQDKSIAGWEKKAYATKVKEMCAILTGLPLSTFEDRANKQKTISELTGQDWRRFVVHPAKGSKSTPLVVYSESKAEMMCETYGLHMEKGSHLNQGHYSEHNMTIRELMQTVGTDCIREKVHPHAWILALYADYKEKVKWGYDKYGETENWLESPKWIVTDCRFPNEGNAVKERGGVVWWIERGVETGDHPSETSMKGYDFDHYIDNGADIDLLIPTVKHALKKFDIL